MKFLAIAAVGLVLPLLPAQREGAQAGTSHAAKPDVDAAVAQLAGDDGLRAHTMALTIRHRWPVLPQALFDGLVDRPQAARRLLDVLAVAPRPAAREWARQQAQPLPERSYDHRLTALAATGEPPAPDDARLLLESLAHEPVGDGFYRLASRLSARQADRLVGRIHAQLLGGDGTVDQLAPVLERMSASGTRALLGMAVTLPADPAFELLRFLHEARPELVQEHLARSLDADRPIDARWLRFAGPVLDRPARVDRVCSILRDAQDPAEGDAAFDALLAAGAIDERVLQLGEVDTTRRRQLRVLRKAIDLVPAGRLVAWLDDEPELVQATAQALTRRRVIEPPLQTALLALLADLEVVEDHTPMAALTALVRGCDAATLARIWPLLFRGRSWRELLQRLEHRDEPFVYQQLLAEINGDHGRDEAQLDVVRLLLVGKGDRRELETLLANAPQRQWVFLRRCRHHAQKLTVAQAQGLFDAAVRSDDCDVAAELLEWALAAQPEAIADRLWQLWNEPPEVEAIEELLEIAMRLLATGPHRGALVTQLDEALAAGPLPERLTSLPYELLDGIRKPLRRADAELCATLVLRLPLTDPEGERRRAERWPDGGHGYPLVAAVANRMRAIDPELAIAAFTACVDELAGDERRQRISRQRLTVLWRSLAAWPGLQQELGAATARLYAFPTDGARDADGLDGAAWALSALERERRGDFAGAAEHYRRAIALLLCDPDHAAVARWLLGDRDPSGGVDPHARLAAAPFRMQWQLARVAGDEAATAAAAALVREFAGHDRATIATLSDSSEETGR